MRPVDPSLLDLHDALLFDLDGTLMHGAQPIPHAAEAVAATREAGRAVAFATNNASRTPAQAAEHLRGIGIPADAAEFVTSPQVAVALLAQDLAPGSTVLVVGGPSLAEEVRAGGLEPVEEDSDDVVAVVQGWSPDLGWARLAEGAYAIRRGARWMATNVDATLPTERGLAPGNGSLVAALRHATGAVPEVAGKPAPGMFEVAAARCGARRALVVGDRLDTDIEGGVRAGLATLLVLTGVDGIESALRAEPVRRPTYITADLEHLTAPFPLPVVEGDFSRCGPVGARWRSGAPDGDTAPDRAASDGDVVLQGDLEDPRVLRAILALLCVHAPESAWTGRLLDADGAEVRPTDR